MERELAVEPLPIIQTQIGQFEMAKKDEGVVLSSQEVTFPAESQVDFEITAKKIPTAVGPGIVIEKTIIDPENYGLRMNEMIAQAQELKQFPEPERPTMLMSLFLSHMQYAYKDVVNELDDEKQQWIKQEIFVDSRFQDTPVSLAKIAQSGYGICRHLAALLLVLANEAGLEGVFVNTVKEFKNLSRKETDYPANDSRPALFRSGEPEAQMEDGHAWVEVLVHHRDQEYWVPMDPSTQLVGDTPERLATFKEAGFKQNLEEIIQLRLERIKIKCPPTISASAWSDSTIIPGDNIVKARIKVSNNSMEDIPIISRDTDQGGYSSRKAETYNGPMELSLLSSVDKTRSFYSLDIQSVENVQELEN